MESILKFKAGNPIETQAAVLDLDVSEQEIPYLNVSDDKYVLSLDLKPQDAVYGLGQHTHGINKRGWSYTSNCSDDPVHTEEKKSLYGAHNFLIVENEKPFGIFVDTPGVVTFDVGYTHYDKLEIHLEDPDYYLYIIEGDSLEDISRSFRKLVGRSYIPPKWAFGYGQSRWGYRDEKDIREVFENYRKNDMPLDSIYLDIDYLDNYKDFTLNEKSFPDFKNFVQEMKDEGIHLVPIIDAAVKVEKGYPVYEEGIEKGYFCKKEDGSEFVAGVWPGKSVFPDFLNDEARAWFGDQYNFLLDQGIEGFWNDMNEPALFYSEDHIKEVFEKLEEYKTANLDISTFFALKDLMGGISNRYEDYASFYHNYQGQKIRHDLVHNLYGYFMTRSAQEAFERNVPDKRILMFSRSSYIGMHRYGGIWLGDNMSWWSHLLLNIKMMPSVNLSGFLFSGADLGGFGADVTEDLLMRWLEFGIFTPLMRNHAALGTRSQEAYRFQDKESFKNIIGLRYALLPYVYSEFMKAALTDGLYMRSLHFAYPEDERARTVEDQLMVGDSLMVAPVYEQNAQGRYVYLPERMKRIRMRSADDYDEEILEAGDHYVKAALNEVLLFIPENKIIPVARPALSTKDLDMSHLGLLGFVTDEASYDLYDDDGMGKEYDLTSNVTTITAKDHQVLVNGPAAYEVDPKDIFVKA